MKIATTSVQFLFNGNIYTQNDGVAMGSPLGPTLANIFVGYYEKVLFSITNRPSTYFRYVDDTFAIFGNADQYNSFLEDLNNLHPALKFTFEIEDNNSLPFLYVLVTKDLANRKYSTSVYRKRTFTGSYMRFESFCHKERKYSLIKTLTHRAMMICSPENLDSELKQLKKLFADNGYPEHLVNKIMSSYVARANPTVWPKKCRVYIKLPYIGQISDRFSKQIKGCVTKCYYATMVKVLFSSRPNFRGMKKDPLPTQTLSNIIYKFSCYCGSNYVGKTTHTLKKRSKEHVPACLLALKEAQAKDSINDFKETKKRKSVQMSSLVQA